MCEIILKFSSHDHNVTIINVKIFYNLFSKSITYSKLSSRTITNRNNLSQYDSDDEEW